MGGFWKEAGAWLSGGAPPTTDIKPDFDVVQTQTEPDSNILNVNEDLVSDQISNIEGESKAEVIPSVSAKRRKIKSTVDSELTNDIVQKSDDANISVQDRKLGLVDTLRNIKDEYLPSEVEMKERDRSKTTDTLGDAKEIGWLESYIKPQASLEKSIVDEITPIGEEVVIPTAPVIPVTIKEEPTPPIPVEDLVSKSDSFSGALFGGFTKPKKDAILGGGTKSKSPKKAELDKLRALNENDYMDISANGSKKAPLQVIDVTQLTSTKNTFIPDFGVINSPINPIPAKISKKQKGQPTFNPAAPGTTPTPAAPGTTPTPTAPGTTTPGAPGTPVVIPITPSRFQTNDELKKSFVKNLKEVWYGTDSDMDFARRGGYEGASKDELNKRTEDLNGTTIILRDNLKDVNEKLVEEVRKKDEAEHEWELARIRIKGMSGQTRIDQQAEIDRLRNDLDVYVLEVARLERKRDNIIKRIGDNEREIIQNRRNVVLYMKKVEEEKKKAALGGKIGKKLENLGKGAETVTSGLYDPKSGFGAGKDWFGPKGFLKAPYKEEAMKRNPVNAPTLYKLGNITQATGSTAARIGLGEMQAVHGSKLIAPMGVGGTVAGSRNRFDLSINPKRITLKDVAGFNRPRAPVQQYTQVTQADGSVINVPVPAPAHYRKPKAPVSMVSRLVKSPVTKPLSHNSALERGVKSVGTFRPMEFTNATMTQFKQVSKPVKVNPQQRQPKPFTISLNRFTNGSNIITTSPIKKNMFASGLESVGSIKGVKVIPQARTNFDLGLIKTINIGEKKEPKVIDVTKAYRTSKNNSAYVNMSSILNVGKNMKKLMKKTKVVK